METVFEELQRELEQKRRDERLLADLQEKATTMHAEVYVKEVRKGKKNYKKMTGFMLQSMFGKKKPNGDPIWMIKDLDVEQILKLITTMSTKTPIKMSQCCNAPLEAKQVEVPNWRHRIDPNEPELKLSHRRCCTKCGNRNAPAT
jgi:hypothetical protein